MLDAPARSEIDQLTLKLLVGLMAVALGPLTVLLEGRFLDSISASYWTLGHSRDVFVGFLLAIAAFLASYNGQSRPQMIVSKVAAGAAVGIALLPCTRVGTFPDSVSLVLPEPCPRIHYACAGIMFVILAFFCCVFYQHAKEKGHREARRRVVIYAVCGVTIVASILVLGIDHLFHPAVTAGIPNLTFWGELAGLSAFGVSWLTASRTLPLLTRPDERHHPLDGPTPATKEGDSAAAA